MRFKTTNNILVDGGEFFNPDWMNHKRISDWLPASPEWKNEKEIKLEDVNLWEVIQEFGGNAGVYAAWDPYTEYYIVTSQNTIIAEFVGKDANQKLEDFLIKHNVPYPKE
jgi:hypothetical protein